MEYSFSDLLDAIQKRNIAISIKSGLNSSYKTAYVGTLRSVLQSWCSDFGLSYVFDGNTNKLYFYDLSAGVTINTKGLETNNRTISFNKTKSLENTYVKGIVAHYSLDGQDKDFSCEGDAGKRVNCRPLTLRDLVGKAPWRSSQPLYSNSASNFLSFDVIELMCFLSSYSPVLREAVTWFDLYGIRTAENARSLVDAQKTTEGIPGMPIKAGGYKTYRDDFDRNLYSLPLLQMTIKAVSDTAFGAVSGTQFNSIYNRLGEEQRSIIDAHKAAGKKLYFFVASRNSKMYGNIVDWESQIGSDYLGKYFIRKFSSTLTSPPQITSAGSDGAKFYKQGVDKMPFSFGYPYKNVASYIDELSSAEDTVTDSFVLVDRNVAFVPPRGEGDAIKTLVETAQAYLPIKLGSVVGILGKEDQTLENKAKPKEGGSSIKSWDAEDDDKCDYLYLGFEAASGLRTSAFDIQTHPDEKKYNHHANEYTTPIELGLNSLKAKTFSIANITFWMPPQSSVREAEQSNATSSSYEDDGKKKSYAGGYMVYLEQKMNSSFSMALPKNELVYSSVPSAFKVAKLDINYKDFNNSTIEDYELITDRNSRKCIPNSKKIRDVMENYCQNMSVSNLNPHETISFEIDGVPTIPFLITDGLASFSVRTGSSGIKTSILFSDYRDNKIEKSEAFLEFKLKQGVNNPYLANPQFKHKQTMSDVTEARTI